MAAAIGKGGPRRGVPAWRALAALLGVFAGSAVLHACFIEERVYDETLAQCDDFCTRVMRECTGENTAYPSFETCTAVCGWLSTRDTDDASATANTLSCRIATLDKGGFEGASDCRTLGPGGNGTCGDDCEAYCSLQEVACGPVDDAARAFCAHSCPALANPEPFNAGVDLHSDTLQCRLAHLSQALVNDNEDNCRQAEVKPPESGDTDCWDEAVTTTREADCRTYCGVVMQACTGEYQVYESREQCEVVCNRAFDDGQPNDSNVNTVRCRRYHAYSALGDPAQHCTHAGPGGDGHCGPGTTGNCESYCSLLAAGCRSGFVARYADASACVAACAGESGAPALRGSVRDGFSDYFDPSNQRYSLDPPPTSDQSLQCRVFYAVRAVAAFDANATADPDVCRDAFAEEGSRCE